MRMPMTKPKRNVLRTLAEYAYRHSTLAPGGRVLGPGGSLDEVWAFAKKIWGYRDSYARYWYKHANDVLAYLQDQGAIDETGRILG